MNISNIKAITNPIAKSDIPSIKVISPIVPLI